MLRKYWQLTKVLYFIQWECFGRRVPLLPWMRFLQRKSKNIFYKVSSTTSITKTCLYNFDPLKPHFYVVKLGFTGVYVIFLISAENIDCGYSLEPPRRGDSNEYPQSMFLSRNMKKISELFIWKFSFLVVIFSVYLNRRVFVMLI